jgi:hypothetical protein
MDLAGTPPQQNTASMANSSGPVTPRTPRASIPTVNSKSPQGIKGGPNEEFGIAFDMIGVASEGQTTPVPETALGGDDTDTIGISSNSPSTPTPSHRLCGNKSENIMIRQTDEQRIVTSVTHAAMLAVNAYNSTLNAQSSNKQNSITNTNLGAIFSVKIDISHTNTLSIGVKDLPTNLLAVSMLKRLNSEKGPGELAGVKLGDIIFGTYCRF